LRCGEQLDDILDGYGFVGAMTGRFEGIPEVGTVVDIVAVRDLIDDVGELATVPPAARESPAATSNLMFGADLIQVCDL
jgi:hypothetical protein